MTPRHPAAPFKYRVIGVDMFDHEDYPVKDCATLAEAKAIVNRHRASPNGSPGMSDRYYIYDQNGMFVAG
jgi:hypothetical protein